MYAYQVWSKNEQGGKWTLEKSFPEDAQHKAQDFAHYLFQDGVWEVVVCRVDLNYGYFIDSRGNVMTLPHTKTESE